MDGVTLRSAPPGPCCHHSRHAADHALGNTLCFLHCKFIFIRLTSVFFSMYLELYWQCKCEQWCDCRPTEERLSSVVWKKTAELFNLFCMSGGGGGGGGGGGE